MSDLNEQKLILTSRTISLLSGNLRQAGTLKKEHGDMVQESLEFLAPLILANGATKPHEKALPMCGVSGWAYIRKHLKPILIGFATGITLMTVFSLIENIVLKIALIIHGG